MRAIPFKFYPHVIYPPHLPVKHVRRSRCTLQDTHTIDLKIACCKMFFECFPGQCLFCMKRKTRHLEILIPQRESDFASLQRVSTKFECRCPRLLWFCEGNMGTHFSFKTVNFKKELLCFILSLDVRVATSSMRAKKSLKKSIAIKMSMIQLEAETKTSSRSYTPTHLLCTVVEDSRINPPRFHVLYEMNKVKQNSNDIFFNI